jgi:hypothetical protein
LYQTIIFDEINGFIDNIEPIEEAIENEVLHEMVNQSNINYKKVSFEPKETYIPRSESPTDEFNENETIKTKPWMKMNQYADNLKLSTLLESSMEDIYMEEESFWIADEPFYLQPKSFRKEWITMNEYSKGLTLVPIEEEDIDLGKDIGKDLQLITNRILYTIEESLDAIDENGTVSVNKNYHEESSITLQLDYREKIRDSGKNILQSTNAKESSFLLGVEFFEFGKEGSLATLSKEAHDAENDSDKSFTYIIESNNELIKSYSEVDGGIMAPKVESTDLNLKLKVE